MRLAVVTGELTYARVAGRALGAMGPLVQRMPAAFPTALLALAEYRDRGLPAEYLQQLEPKRQPIVQMQLERPVQPIRPGETATATIVMTIADGWHIYAADPGSAYAIPLQAQVDTEPRLSGVRVHYPEPSRVLQQQAETLRVLEGRVVMRLEVPMPEDLLQSVEAVRVRCRVRYQACTSDRCLAPDEAVVEFLLPVAR